MLHRNSGIIQETQCSKKQFCSALERKKTCHKCKQVQRWVSQVVGSTHLPHCMKQLSTGKQWHEDYILLSALPWVTLGGLPISALCSGCSLLEALLLSRRFMRTYRQVWGISVQQGSTWVLDCTSFRSPSVKNESPRIFPSHGIEHHGENQSANHCEARRDYEDLGLQKRAKACSASAHLT